MMEDEDEGEGKIPWHQWDGNCYCIHCKKSTAKRQALNMFHVSANDNQKPPHPFNESTLPACLCERCVWARHAALDNKEALGRGIIAQPPRLPPLPPPRLPKEPVIGKEIISSDNCKLGSMYLMSMLKFMNVENNQAMTGNISRDTLHQCYFIHEALGGIINTAVKRTTVMNNLAATKRASQNVTKKRKAVP